MGHVTSPVAVVVVAFVSVFVVTLGAVPSPTGRAVVHTRAMTRRPLFRQLLLLQMLLVVLMVGAIGWLSAVQADQSFRVSEARRLLATAESLA